jgi:hypothetical protein
MLSVRRTYFVRGEVNHFYEELILCEVKASTSIFTPSILEFFTDAEEELQFLFAFCID